MADASDQETAPTWLWDIIRRIAAAIGTSIGVRGFGAFTASLVLWTRLNSVGIPGVKAAARIPRANPIATGAVFTVPTSLTAAAAVMAASLSTREGAC